MSNTQPSAGTVKGGSLRETKQTLTFLLRAFRHRNYRLFFGGQGLSLVGTWMQQIAVSWLVYRMTGSALILGGSSALSDKGRPFYIPCGRGLR